MAEREARWLRDARRLLPELRRWRIAFHEEPELAYEEAHTRERILRTLDELGIPHRSYEGFTGVLATLGGNRRGPTVAVRADMDGLPIAEATGLSFSSKVPGKMHACGHDVHMASALGAAALLARHPEHLGGPVKFLFQPAEEDGQKGGAGPFIQRGCLERPRVRFVVGQHVAPEIPAGSIGWKAGPLMAAADHLLIRVRGTPGHAAYPHRGADSIVVAAEVVSGLQALVSRSRDPLDPVVISIGSIHGGTRRNILPSEVRLEGTVRTFSPTTRARMEELIRTRVRHIARSLGARAEVRYTEGYPSTVNHPEATRVATEAIARELGPDKVLAIERPVMGAEDFSRYLERVPGTFWFLGAGVAGTHAVLHSPTFAPPELSLITGAAALASAVVGLQGHR